ncbi:MAG: hypothetical protein LBL93_05395 [Ruminococcus sp.]|nr:hypothetical protein [Ruminococcus sp.]
MKLSEYEANGINLRYHYSKPREPDNNEPKMVVSLSTIFASPKTLDNMLFLSRFCNIHKLIFAADREYSRKGQFLVKDKQFLVRDAIIECIEKYRTEAGVKKENVYFTAHCSTAFATLLISVEMGYNAVLASYLGYHVGDIAQRWYSKGKELDFRGNYRVPGANPKRNIVEINSYTGLSRDEYNKFVYDYVDNMPQEKWDKANIYLHWGDGDERYVIGGKESIDDLVNRGANVVYQVDSGIEDHFKYAPWFEAFMEKIFTDAGMKLYDRYRSAN